MESSNKRIAKNTLLLYFRMFIIMAVNLYISRMILNILGVEDFGIYNVVGGIVLFLSFINSSLSAASSRFITYALGENNEIKVQITFSNILAIHLILSVVIIILAETIGLWFMFFHLQIPNERMNAAFWVYQCSIITSVISIISVPYNATIIANEKMSAFAYITIIDVFLKLIVTFALQIIPYDKLIIYAALLLVIQLFDRIIYGMYCISHFKETKSKPRIDRKQFKEILIFASWTMNGNLAYIGYTQGLNILLNIFFGPMINAARGIAVQVQGVVKNFCTNFQMALNPQLVKSYSQGNYKYMHQLLSASSKFSFFLLLLISLPVMLEAEIVLHWWLGVVPDYTILFLRLILCSSMLSVLSNPIVVSVHATGKIKKFQLIEGSMLLLIVPISYLMLKYLHSAPEIVFVIHIIIEMLTQYMRLKIGLPLIKMELKFYVRDILFPVVKVLILSPIFPLFMYIHMKQNIGSFFFYFFVLCS